VGLGIIERDLLRRKNLRRLRKFKVRVSALPQDA